MRPITITSCVNKIFERMINDRLVWMSKHKDWFDKNQNGFRKSRLRIDNLVDLVLKTEISKQDNLNTIAVFLDVSYDSAYDNVIYISREITKTRVSIKNS